MKELNIVPPALGTFDGTPCEWLEACKLHCLYAYVPLFGLRNEQNYEEAITPYVEAIKKTYGITEVIIWDGPTADDCYNCKTYADIRTAYQQYYNRFITMKKVCSKFGIQIKYVNIQAISVVEHFGVILNSTRDVGLECRISIYTRTIGNLEMVHFNGNYIPLEQAIKDIMPSHGFGLNCIGYDQIDSAIEQLKKAGLLEKLKEILPNSSGIAGHILDASDQFGGHKEVKSCQCPSTMAKWVKEKIKTTDVDSIGLCCGSSFEQITAIQKQLREVPGR